MKMILYPKLAWTGMRKNRRLSLPYTFSCIGMVMMYTILESLSRSPMLKEMKGGGTLGGILSLGRFVIAAFSLLFLLYTNSFLTRKRYKEFGLYSILGMDKRGISRIVLCESAITAGIGLGAGLALGILFSKLAELGLLNAIRREIDYTFRFSFETVRTTLLIYLTVFALLAARSVLHILRNDPIALLRSENAGEKPPKSNQIPAIAGTVLLAAAYYMAVTIQSPLTAVLLFMAAVILVIIATYLLFIAGSVVVCRALQKNKRYYYRKQHFISVSSMLYRMRRNGAGLASVCILATMVLVTTSSTTSLYFGADDSLRSMHTRNTEVTMYADTPAELTDAFADLLRTGYEDRIREYDCTAEDVLDYKYVSTSGTFEGGKLQPDYSAAETTLLTYESYRSVYFFDLEDYNRLTGSTIALEPDEAIVCPQHCRYDPDRITLGGLTLRVAGKTDLFWPVADAETVPVPTLMIVVSDLSVLSSCGDEISPLLYNAYYYGYNCGSVNSEREAELFYAQLAFLTDLYADSENGYSYRAGCLAAESADFLNTYGGLFFMGILLSVVFLFAATVIIYYKQVSEGYEDSSRFAVMRKVGMTGRDIRKSVNSQILTVFFAPLLFAGVHLAFAMPMVWKMLQMFGLRNLPLFIGVTAATYAGFGVFYAVIYKLTAGAYYSIVSTADNT